MRALLSVTTFGSGAFFSGGGSFFSDGRSVSIGGGAKETKRSRAAAPARSGEGGITVLFFSEWTENTTLFFLGQDGDKLRRVHLGRAERGPLGPLNRDYFF